MSPSRELPARPNLEHLRNEAKQRLRDLRRADAEAKLASAQLLVARDYGFPSWRALKAAVDRREIETIFAAARNGDLATIRRAVENGFNPATLDDHGQTIHQVAKGLGHEPIEL